MVFACSIPCLIDAKYFKEMRYKKLKTMPIDKARGEIRIKGFATEIKPMMLEFPQIGNVQYKIRYKEGYLNESVYPDSHDHSNEIFFRTKATEEEAFEFLKEIGPKFGIIHSGILPGRTLSSEETLKAIQKILKTEKELMYEMKYYRSVGGGKISIQTTNGNLFFFRANHEYTLNNATEEWLKNAIKLAEETKNIALNAIEKQRIRLIVS